MATLTISNFNKKASRSTISFSYTMTLASESYVVNTSTQQVKQKEIAGTLSRIVEGVDSASGGDNLSGSVIGTYTRINGTDGPTAHTVKLTCYYTKQQSSRNYVQTGWTEWTPNGMESLGTSPTPVSQTYLPVDGTSGYILTSQWNATLQVYSVYYISYTRSPTYSWTDWTSWTNVSGSVNIAITQEVGTYYKSPAEFTFTGCTSGAGWYIDEGLDSIIGGLDDFPKYAYQWKAWANQQLPSKSCPSFSGEYLTASNLNDIHNYVGTGNSYKGASADYPGDEISADMFNSLATKINAG